MGKVIDCISYNGEHELFEIRYNILSPYVDEFRVIEFDKTFSGKDKFMRSIYLAWLPKVKHYLVTEEQWSKYWEEAKRSPNTNYGEGAKHWLREWCMKESIRDCLTDLDDDDIVMVGDCDEIWELSPFIWKATLPAKLKLKVYSYFLNNRSNENFWGTLFARWGWIKNKCLNELRNNVEIRTKNEYGWHFTSMGGYDKVKEKLMDSYTDESYATEEVLNNLEENIKNNKDFLGRDFKYRLDEEDWPTWLKENKEQYKYLCR